MSCINTVSDFGNVREAVCVSVQKIMDACRDQDCMEDIPVYLTQCSQETLNCATSVKARCAELLYADVDVEPVCYREGYYSVSIQYYYRVIADAVLCAVRPVTIYGLATFGKRLTLFGGENGAMLFSSNSGSSREPQPEAVVEAIDPVVLQTKIVDMAHCRSCDKCCCMESGLPAPVAEAFDDELVLSGMERQLQVTLGQFGLVRLQRQTQLLIPSYDYCMPDEDCCENGCKPQECPCETFAKMEFPIQAFFPQSDATTLCTGSAAGVTTGAATPSCCNTCTTAAPVQEETTEPQEERLPTRTIPVTGGNRRT